MRTANSPSALHNIVGSSLMMLSVVDPRVRRSSRLHHVIRGSRATDAAQKRWSSPLVPGLIAAILATGTQ